MSSTLERLKEQYQHYRKELEENQAPLKVAVQNLLTEIVESQRTYIEALEKKVEELEGEKEDLKCEILEGHRE